MMSPQSFLSILPGLMAAVSYGAVSGSMSFMNKMLLTSYEYKYPDCIMLYQVVVTTIVLTICRLLNICDLPAWTLKSKEFFFPSLCFAIHTTLALAALGALSIPIYNVLRRMLPLASLLMSVYILKQKPSRNIVLSVMLMVLGTLTTGFGDLRFTYLGYFEAIASFIAQSIYLTYVQKTGVEKNVSALYVTYINSINCVPLLLIETVANGNLLKSIEFPGFYETSFVIAFALNVILGCLLNYTLFLCAAMNSALTTSIVGVIKGVISTTVGFFTFGGASINFLTIGGLILNAGGGTIYVAVKYIEKCQKLSQAPLTDIRVNASRRRRIVRR